mgnify:CR=1 FL=1
MCEIFLLTFFIFIQTVLGNEKSMHFVTKAALLKEVQSTWQIPLLQVKEQEIVESEPLEQVPAPLTLQQRLNRIIIPKLSISDLPFNQALKVITDIVRIHDMEGDGVNFILIDAEHKAPTVDLNVQSISCVKLLDYLREMTNFEMSFEDNSVIFRDPVNKVVKVITKVFPVSRGCILQLLSYTAREVDKPENEQSEEDKLRMFFAKLGINFLENGVGFAYDGQNIIVSHRIDCLQKIEKVIELYRQSKQIAIETKFLEVQQGVLEELGLKLNFGANNQVKIDTKTSLRDLAQLHYNKSYLKNSENTSLMPQFPNILNLGSSIGNFLDANAILNKYQMNILLKAIEQRSDADLMSAPKVTVLSGRKAEIVVAQELRYPESYRDGRSDVGSKSEKNSSAGSTILAGVPENFTTRNIGVEMTVIPLVEGDNRIHLTLEPCVTEFEGFVQYGGSNVVTFATKSQAFESGYYQPIFSTRKIKTEVSLKDGSTLVMGGLTREEIKETNDKIPILSAIPLFGKLFTSKGQTSQKKNLVIFVTANLVDENGKHFMSKEMPLEKRL